MGKWISAAIVFVIAAVLGALTANKLRGGESVVVNLDSSQVTPGWKRHTVSAAGFQIDLPVEYTPFDPKDPKIRQAIQAAASSNPEVEKVLLQAIGATQFVFWAFDLKEVSGGFAKNVNVLQQYSNNRMPAPGDNLDSIRDSIVKSLPGNSRLVDVRAVKLPVGNALATIMEFDLANERGKYKTWSYGYSVVTGDKQLTLSFTSLAKDAEALQPIAERAMETFRPFN